ELKCSFASMGVCAQDRCAQPSRRREKMRLRVLLSLVRREPSSRRTATGSRAFAARPVGARPHTHPVAVGDLIQWRGKWITEPPTHCPNGHRLGPHQTLVGHTACGGHGGGGHTIWHCL